MFKAQEEGCMREPFGSLNKNENSVLNITLDIYNKMIKYNTELLLHLKNKYNAQLTGSEYLILNRDSNITYICACGKECSKTFRSILRCNGMICRKCSDRKKIKKIRTSNYNKKRTVYTKQKLIQYCTKFNFIPTVVCGKEIKQLDDIPEDITRRQNLSGMCKNCNILFTKTIRTLVERSIPWCYSCIRECKKEDVM